ncbi:MAG: hypothetical protein H0V54_07900 [Chthoniobacterales bacterium]|nr:hypothetical protein [Chthoniobacterales bacterium]
MRILLDESVPVQVRKALLDHDVRTAVEMGWRGISNGKLLENAKAAGFDLLIIADKNLRYQQNLAARGIGILELWTNHRPTLERNFDRIRAAVESANIGKYLTLGERP